MTATDAYDRKGEKYDFVKYTTTFLLLADFTVE